jgi:hypothetical protein
VTVVLAILALAAAVFVVDRILLALENHGLIDYRQTVGRRGRSAAGSRMPAAESPGDAPPENPRPGSLRL